MVLFIDDLNMPLKEKYSAQPPLEIMRQQLDEGGWYDLESKEWKFLEDMTFIGAMGPPSQGRNQVSLRVTRHFNLLYVEPYLPTSLSTIFSSLMDWYFLNTGKEMLSKILNLKDTLINSTIMIYNSIKSSK
jgi:dynein heavy chain, axonemal